MKTLAIYLGTRYVAREYDPTRAGLWALLGPDYTRESAGKLADSLNRERDQEREDKADLKAAREALKEPGDIPWEEVQ